MLVNSLFHNTPPSLQPVRFTENLVYWDLVLVAVWAALSQLTICSVCPAISFSCLDNIGIVDASELVVLLAGEEEFFCLLFVALNAHLSAMHKFTSVVLLCMEQAQFIRSAETKIAHGKQLVVQVLLAVLLKQFPVLDNVGRLLGVHARKAVHCFIFCRVISAIAKLRPQFCFAMLGEQSPVLGIVDSHLRVQACDAVQRYKIQLNSAAIAEVRLKLCFVMLGKQSPVLGVVDSHLRVEGCETYQTCKIQLSYASSRPYSGLLTAISGSRAAMRFNTTRFN